MIGGGCVESGVCGMNFLIEVDSRVGISSDNSMTNYQKHLGLLSLPELRLMCSVLAADTSRACDSNYNCHLSDPRVWHDHSHALVPPSPEAREFRQT